MDISEEKINISVYGFMPTVINKILTSLTSERDFSHNIRLSLVSFEEINDCNNERWGGFAGSEITFVINELYFSWFKVQKNSLLMITLLAQ